MKKTISRMMKSLTKEQAVAAKRVSGAVQILAGAGTGKTSTIVARVLYMMSEDIDPKNILVMTFTNKAAGEMRERVEKQSRVSPKMTTFHSFCMYFLRDYMEVDSTNGRSTAFGVADEATQKTIIGSFVPDSYINPTIDGEKIKVDKFMGVIQNLQNYMIEDIDDPELGKIEIINLVQDLMKNNKQHQWITDSGFESDQSLMDLAMVYHKYKNQLKSENLVDFDDLINLTIKVLESSNPLKEKIRKTYKYIMVDEFQDTNLAQMKLLDLLIEPEKNNICVVGDELQSIYGWRGADINFILNFKDSNDKCLVVNLNRNFRSTKTIVNHANKLVSNSAERHKDKEDLIANTTKDGEFDYKLFRSLGTEASYIAKNIKRRIRMGTNPSDIAMLYRGRMIVATLENALIKERVPYKILNGRALLKKQIVSEFLSVIHYITNKRNETALGRSLVASKSISQAKFNTNSHILAPSDYLTQSDSFLKNLGLRKLDLLNLKKFKKFLSILETNYHDQDIVMSDFIMALDNHPMIKQRSKKLFDHTEGIKRISDSVESKLWNDVQNMSNVSDLIKQFHSVDHFVEHISLETEVEKDEDEGKDKVSLMTIHNSKGLEFKSVYLPGFNEDLIPLSRSQSDLKLLEEERRLAYVAITRAKRTLFISSSSQVLGKTLKPSRFISDAGIKPPKPYKSK